MDEAEQDRKVLAIDRRINLIKYKISSTEAEIQRLIALNEGRHKTIRSLGRERSEILTYELNLTLPPSVPAS